MIFFLASITLMYFAEVKSTTVRSPTPAPTGYPTLNATITNGYLTFWNQPLSTGIYVGLTSRKIQKVIDTYFPKPSYKMVVADTLKTVWLNSTTGTTQF